MNARRAEERWMVHLHRTVRPYGIALFACILLADGSLRVVATPAEVHAKMAPITPQHQHIAPQAATPSLASANYSVAFTPGHALPLVLETIRTAKSMLLVAAYSLTSKPVATALGDAHRRGVQVFVLVDAGEATKGYSAAQFLANERVPVRTNARYALQHNKFIVVDGTTCRLVASTTQRQQPSAMRRTCWS